MEEEEVSVRGQKYIWWAAVQPQAGLGKCPEHTLVKVNAVLVFKPQFLYLGHTGKPTLLTKGHSQNHAHTPGITFCLM
jgi:hypothetical protein